MEIYKLEKSDLTDLSVQDQKLIKEFLVSEDLKLDDIDNINETDIYDVYALEIEIGSQEWYIIPDDSKMDDHVLDEIQDYRSDYVYMYKEGITSGNIDPVGTSFKDWTEEIIQYDGWISVVGSYDGDYSELSGNAVYFRRN